MMLQNIQDKSKHWLVKGLFILIVLSFVSWGIGDMFRNYVSMRPVATINDHSITSDEFTSRLQVLVARAQSAAKGQITAEQIQELGLPKKVLDSLIEQTLIQQEIKRRGILATDDAVRRHIQSIPAFLDEKGSFDKKAFSYLLHENHLTESKFIHDVRSEIQTNQLFTPLTAGLSLPKSYVNLLFRSFFEQRIFVVVTVPFDKMSVKETPNDQELLEFYQKNQQQFTMPETRKVTLLEIDPKSLATQIEVSPDKIQEEYANHKEDYSVPERRSIQQANFKDEATAQKAIDVLKKGKSLQTVTKTLSGEYKDLGLVTQQQLPDQASNPVFNAKENTFIGPLLVGDTHQIYVVTKIEEPYEKKFDDVRAQIETDLKTQIANDKIYELKNSVEDMLAAGSTLSEIAQKNNFKIHLIESLNKSGNQDGKSLLPNALTDADQELILDQAFSLTEGADSPVVDVKDGSSYVVHVDAVKAAHIPAFDDIRATVTKAWENQKRFEFSAAIAQQLAKDSRSSADLIKMATSRKLPIKVLAPLSRVESEKNEAIHKLFMPQLIAQIFSLKSDKTAIGVTPIRDGGGLQIVMLQKILPFDPNSFKDKREQMEKTLADLAFKDVMQTYVNALRAQSKISINKEIFDAISERG